MIDGENGGDDDVDPTCAGCEKVKNEDVDETHAKNQGVYSKGEMLHVEKNGL